MGRSGSQDRVRGHSKGELSSRPRQFCLVNVHATLGGTDGTLRVYEHIYMQQKCSGGELKLM